MHLMPHWKLDPTIWLLAVPCLPQKLVPCQWQSAGAAPGTSHRVLALHQAPGLAGWQRSVGHLKVAQQHPAAESLAAECCC